MTNILKSAYIVIGTLALTLSACTQDDVLPVDTGANNLVRFRTSLPELSTRAQVITNSNLPYFHVTAFDLADGDLLTGNVMNPLFANERLDVGGKSDQTFTSAGCFWPAPTKESHEVKFFGFYPETAAVEGSQLVNASTADGVSYKFAGFRVAKEMTEQFDFLTAYASGSMADNLFSGVTLPFNHQLSRIEVKAYGAHKSCDIEIAGVRICGTGVLDTFTFKPVESGGEWTGSPERGFVEYIYRNGDKIFTCGRNNKVDVNNAESILGSKNPDGRENCAMIIPANYAMWDYDKDPRNSKNQMYISVLIRVTDATPTTGKNPVNAQRYPYTDLSQGADALKVPKVLLAVNKNSGTVSTRVYKKDNNYYTDSICSKAYNLPATETVKEFGWAALPVKGNWAPGNIYTYTLNYSHGVGLLCPDVNTTAPGAGDPVISDRVGLTYTVKEWLTGGGSEFVVPGS